jgi:hypothetical protein
MARSSYLWQMAGGRSSLRYLEPSHAWTRGEAPGDPPASTTLPPAPRASTRERIAHIVVAARGSRGLVEGDHAALIRPSATFIQRERALANVQDSGMESPLPLGEGGRTVGEGEVPEVSARAALSRPSATFFPSEKAVANGRHSGTESPLPFGESTRTAGEGGVPEHEPSDAALIHASATFIQREKTLAELPRRRFERPLPLGESTRRSGEGGVPGNEPSDAAVTHPSATLIPREKALANGRHSGTESPLPVEEGTRTAGEGGIPEHGPSDAALIRPSATFSQEEKALTNASGRRFESPRPTREGEGRVPDLSAKAARIRPSATFAQRERGVAARSVAGEPADDGAAPRRRAPRWTRPARKDQGTEAPSPEPQTKEPAQRTVRRIVVRPAEPAAPLARGFSSPFGIRQG